MNYDIRDILNVFQEQEKEYLRQITEREKKCREDIKKNIGYDDSNVIYSKFIPEIKSYRNEHAYLSLKEWGNRRTNLRKFSEKGDTWKPTEEFFNWFKDSVYVTEDYVLKHRDKYNNYLEKDLNIFKENKAKIYDINFLSQIPLIVPFKKRAGKGNIIKIPIQQYNLISEAINFDTLLDVPIFKNPENYNLNSGNVIKVKNIIRFIKGYAERNEPEMFNFVKKEVVSYFYTKAQEFDNYKTSVNNILRIIDRNPMAYEKLLWEIEHGDQYTEFSELLYESIYIKESSSVYQDDLETQKLIRARQLQLIKDIINQNNVFDKFESDQYKFLDFLWRLSDNDVLVLMQNGNEHTGFNIFSNLFLKTWGSENDDGIKAFFVLSSIQHEKEKKMPLIGIYQTKNVKEEDKCDFFLLKSTIATPKQLHSALAVSENDEDYKNLINTIKVKYENFYHSNILNRLECMDIGSEAWINEAKKHEWILGETIIKYNDGVEDYFFAIGGKYDDFSDAVDFYKYLDQNMHKFQMSELATKDYLKQLKPDREIEYGDYINYEAIEASVKEESKKAKQLIGMLETLSGNEMIVSNKNNRNTVSLFSSNSIMKHDDAMFDGYTSSEVHHIIKYSYSKIDDGYVTLTTNRVLNLRIKNNLNEMRSKWMRLLVQLRHIKSVYNELVNEIVDLLKDNLSADTKWWKEKDIEEYVRKATMVEYKENFPTKEKEIEIIIDKKIKEFKKSLESSLVSQENNTDGEVLKDLHELIKYFINTTTILPAKDYSKFFYENNILIKFLKLTDLNIHEYITRCIKVLQGYMYEKTTSPIKQKSYYVWKIKQNSVYSLITYPIYFGLKKGMRDKIYHDVYFQMLFDVKKEDFIMPVKIVDEKEKKKKINEYIKFLKKYQKEFLEEKKSSDSSFNDIMSFDRLPNETKEEFKEWLQMRKFDTKENQFITFFLQSLYYKNNFKEHQKFKDTNLKMFKNTPKIQKVYKDIQELDNYEYILFDHVTMTVKNTVYSGETNYDKSKLLLDNPYHSSYNNEEKDSGFKSKAREESVAKRIKEYAMPDEELDKWIDGYITEINIFLYNLRNSLSLFEYNINSNNYYTIDFIIAKKRNLYLYLKEIINIDAYDIISSIEHISNDCSKEKDRAREILQEVLRNLPTPLADRSEERLEEERRQVTEQEEFYNKKCRDEVNRYWKNIKIKLKDVLFNLKYNNGDYYIKIDVIFAKEKYFFAQTLNYISYIKEYLSGSKDTIIIDSSRDAGVVQDEFNDPRYRDKDKKNITLLTGVPVGRDIIRVNINEYVGRKFH